jgi:hypothetical protein
MKQKSDEVRFVSFMILMKINLGKRELTTVWIAHKIPTFSSSSLYVPVNSSQLNACISVNKEKKPFLTSFLLIPAKGERRRKSFSIITVFSSPPSAFSLSLSFFLSLSLGNGASSSS